MRKLLLLLALVALVPYAGHAQTPEEQRFTLLWAYDLDGEAADDNQVVTTADLLDATTFTILAQPDVCRLIDMTVTDANSSISAGVITFTGTDCLGNPKVCSFTFASGGSGVKSLTCTDGGSAYFSNIASIVSGALTGEGGAGVDTMIVGYTSNSVNGWAMYGVKYGPDALGMSGVDPTRAYQVAKRITTSGSLSTTVTDVIGADDAFDPVSVGDLLIINYQGSVTERRVTAKASADSITIDSAINLPAAGVTFSYKKLWYSTNPNDRMSFSVWGFRTALIDWSVDANADTGGVVMLLECRQWGPETPPGKFVQIDTLTIATGSTQANTSESINLELLPYDRCRMGFRFGVGDDADASPEDLNVNVTLRK